jgi:phage gp36-like protein
MTYAIRDDLVQRYGADDITQRESVLGAGALDLILVDADVTIDGYLVGGYTLPFDPVPPKLVQIACAIARYNLMGDSASEAARSNYTDSISWLKDVQNGVVVLQAAAPIQSYGPSMVAFVEPVKSVFKRNDRP